MAHTDSHPRAGDAPSAASTSPEKATLTGTLVHLWPYIWPGDRVDLKMRVVWSMVLLLIAKLATLSVPFTFKWAIDALNGTPSAPVQPSNWSMWLIASPLLMTASYGAVRVLMAVLTQWRDGIFARVAMHAVRKLAYITFVDPRAGAWPHRHRSDRADGDPAADSDHRRGVAADGRAALAVRLALRARHRDHGRGLHVLHLSRDRMADRNPPQDERFRHRSEYQGDRLAVELRDGEVFQRRAARSRTL